MSGKIADQLAAIDGQDKSAASEVQQIMSDINQAETLASTVMKMDCIKASIIGNI